MNLTMALTEYMDRALNESLITALALLVSLTAFQNGAMIMAMAQSQHRAGSRLLAERTHLFEYKTMALYMDLVRFMFATKPLSEGMNLARPLIKAEVLRGLRFRSEGGSRLPGLRELSGGSKVAGV